MDNHTDHQRMHAVIIGGSIAGLLAARVLSDHFRRVTILERDPVNNHPESRKGQPQTRHFHGLLAQGLRILERLFPGLKQALEDGGATVVDTGKALRWYHFDDYKVPFDSGLIGVMMSRPFLEWHIRQRVLDIPNVTLRTTCVVRELETTADKTRITGANVADRDDENQTETIESDLVVDACGRGSVTPRWLEYLGYEPPVEEEVKVRVGYATRIYRRRPDDPMGGKLVLTFPTPPLEKRMAVLGPIEDDRWIATAVGWAGDYPPDEEAGYLEFIRSLPVSDVYDTICQAEPLSDITIHKFPSNRRRRYEKLNRFPDGYLVMGDAVASFNPIYGQGMTSSAMQCQMLDDVLHRQKTMSGLWRLFFNEISKVVERPWQLATGEDFRYPETEGKKPVLTDLVNRYVTRVHRAAHHDPVVYNQFLLVMNLIDPATSLMQPRIAWRVLRGK